MNKIETCQSGRSQFEILWPLTVSQWITDMLQCPNCIASWKPIPQESQSIRNSVSMYLYVCVDIWSIGKCCCSKHHKIKGLLCAICLLSGILLLNRPYLASGTVNWVDGHCVCCLIDGLCESRQTEPSGVQKHARSVANPVQAFHIILFDWVGYANGILFMCEGVRKWLRAMKLYLIGAVVLVWESWNNGWEQWSCAFIGAVSCDVQEVHVILMSAKMQPFKWPYLAGNGLLVITVCCLVM